MKKINKKIFVIEPMFSENAFLKKKILNKFNKVHFNYKKISKKKIINQIANFDGVILGLQKFDSDVINAAPNLSIIAKFGVGMDNVDVELCKKKKIKLKKATGCNSISVAEVVVANAISLLRKVNINNSQMHKMVWKKETGNELFKKKIGVIGVGSVGKEVIKRLKPFNVSIFANDIKIDKKFFRQNNINYLSKNKIFSSCDVITIHTPLTYQTENLINKKTIRNFKENSILINTARGKIVNLEEILQTVERKKIKMYLDVFPEEPYKKLSLLKNKNHIITPHICGTSIEGKIRIGEKNIQDLIKHFI